MPVQKLRVISGNTETEYTPVTTSSGAASAGQVPALNASGLIDPSMVPGYEQQTMAASEAIGAGALVNVWNNSGTANVRNADNSVDGKRANGFAPAAIASGASGVVNLGTGIITGLSGLTPGIDYFLGTVGGIVATAPSTTGNVWQPVGRSLSATTFQFQAQTGVVRG